MWHILISFKHEIKNYLSLLAYSLVISYTNIYPNFSYYCNIKKQNKHFLLHDTIPINRLIFSKCKKTWQHNSTGKLKMDILEEDLTAQNQPNHAIHVGPGYIWTNYVKRSFICSLNTWYISLKDPVIITTAFFFILHILNFKEILQVPLLLFLTL